ncbi:MAG: hypothetical protein CL674_01895 [Bdellovibrionaceae bacterium]|nr:hypothetical protein [Pseudobdellovibrionaceae bacterium]
MLSPLFPRLNWAFSATKNDFFKPPRPYKKCENPKQNSNLISCVDSYTIFPPILDHSSEKMANMVFIGKQKGFRVSLLNRSWILRSQ